MNEETNEYVADTSSEFDNMSFDDFMSNLQEEFATTTTTDQVDEPYEDSTDITEVDETETSDFDNEDITPTQETEETPAPESDEQPQFNNPRQNEAFKVMRENLEHAKREAQEMAQYKSFLDDMAKQSGISTEQLIEQTRQVMLQRQAQEQNVPVEILERMQEQERQLQSVAQQQRSVDFNAKIGTMVQNLKLSEEDVRTFFNDCRSNNVDLYNVPNVELVYKGMYADKLIERGIQERLELKRKRTTQAQINPTNTTVNTNTSGYSDKDIDSALARFGVDPDLFR